MEPLSPGPVYVTTASIVSAVGLDAPSTCAAIRGDISGFGETSYVGNDGEPIVGAVVPGLPLTLRAHERLEAMLQGAIAECLRLRPDLRDGEVPLLLGVAEPERPGGLPVGRAKEMVARVERALGFAFHRDDSRVIAAGHVSAFHGLARAREALSRDEARACVVACVDSLVNAQTLAWLDAHQRLKTGQNSDGVIPGEGAACMVVERQPRRGEPWVRVLGLGFAREEASVLDTSLAFRGEGMTAALKAALAEAGRGMHEIHHRVSDVAGEAYGFREVSLAMSRTLRVRVGEMPLWHPAECLGDTGAAAGCVQHVLFAHRAWKGCVRGPGAVCHASGASGGRAVSVVECRPMGG